MYHHQANRTGSKTSVVALSASFLIVCRYSDFVDRSVIDRLANREELLLSLMPNLLQLEASAHNLALPDHHSRALFAGEVVERGLANRSPARGPKLPRHGLAVALRRTRRLSRSKSIWKRTT